MRLIISDRGYFAFLALLPFIMGVLSLSVPGTVGFGVPDPMGNAPNEPGQILVLLNVGAIFMGTALTVRDLIGERAIFRREQAVGLSTTAYLLAKVGVYAFDHPLVAALPGSRRGEVSRLIANGGHVRAAPLAGLKAWLSQALAPRQAPGQFGVNGGVGLDHNPGAGCDHLVG